MATGKIPQTAAGFTDISTTLNGVDVMGKVWYDPNTRTVRIYGVARKSSNITASTAIGRVPASLRPASEVTIVGIMGTESGGCGAYTCRVATDGFIYQSLGNTIRDVMYVGEWKI